MFIEERHQAILDLLQKNGRISIGEIEEQFEVSLDSARRDLRILEEKGMLKRTHGGAIPLRQVAACKPRVYDIKDIKVSENYAAIAKKAAAMVCEGDVVYLTSGSFGVIMLTYLPKHIAYKLVVNSATLADALKYWDNVEVYVTGGRMRQNGGTSMVDVFASAFIRTMRFDICFLTGAGADTQFGHSNSSAETAAFQRAVADSSRRKILLMPGQKIGVKAFIRVCDLNRFDTLITDREAEEDELARIREAGVEIVVADGE